ncbi:hypothetical protein CEY15_06365 [Dietzia natronolimnaea]|uniref:DUF732 domain-containing protein n=1 Tax=Dietzia natronolimnaea TaxID=161920 RepID=A0A2A2WRS9_9ACTN|nr:hypothetical protein [Dietzia natronolimnaea]PAY23861.1 hypothetical protein CEY15_06365 [Dietzia natronolimnaea]
MKKTIAVIGSAAALSFSGAGLAAAQSDLPGLDGLDSGSVGAPTAGETDLDDVETPAEVSEIAQQLCGTISAYDFLGSVGAVAPGLSGDECEANADLAISTALTGDISGAVDILRGIAAEVPGDADGDATDSDDTTTGDDVQTGDDDAVDVDTVETDA